MSNILIAEFMGLESEQTPKGLTLFVIERLNPNKLNDSQLEFYEPNELKYDSDWNWLMPVVDKIEQQTSNGLIMYPESCYWNSFGENELDDEFSGESRLESVYLAVVAMIKSLK